MTKFRDDVLLKMQTDVLEGGYLMTDKEKYLLELVRGLADPATTLPDINIILSPSGAPRVPVSLHPATQSELPGKV